MVAGIWVLSVRCRGSDACALQGALGLQHNRAIDHSAVELGSARRSGLRGKHTPGPIDGLRARGEGNVDGRDLARMDAELGAKAMASRPCQVGEQARFVVELRRDTGHGRRQSGDTRRYRKHRGCMREAVGLSPISRSRSSA